MARMNLFSRMPLCGMISGYNTGDPAMRADFSPILMRRITIRGFIVIDFMAKFAEGKMQLAKSVSNPRPPPSTSSSTAAISASWWAR